MRACGRHAGDRGARRAVEKAVERGVASLCTVSEPCGACARVARAARVVGACAAVRARGPPRVERRHVALLRALEVLVARRAAVLALRSVPQAPVISEARIIFKCLWLDSSPDCKSYCLTNTDCPELDLNRTEPCVWQPKSYLALLKTQILSSVVYS